jgi:hypothetical protein
MPLPYYSVSERWVRVEDIPLRPNRKVDKTQLECLAESADAISADSEHIEAMNTRPDTAIGNLTVPIKAAMSHPGNTQESFRALLDEKSDLEKACPAINVKSGASVECAAPLQTPATLAEPGGSYLMAWLRHRALIAYRCFLLPILFANTGVACWLLDRYVEDGQYPLPSIATVTASDLCATILIRSEPFINFLFYIFSSAPTWAPLRLRRVCANVFHLGGNHVGCAIAAVFWFLIFTVGASLEMGKNADERTISAAPTVL